MQIYDTILNTWQPLAISGNAPSLRHSFCLVSDGLSLYLYGGEQESTGEVLGDFYVMNRKSQTWIQISSEISIPPRKGACMKYFFPYFFVFGGIDVNGVFLNDLWMVDQRTFDVTQLLPTGDIPNPVAYHECFTVKVDEDLKFYVVFGKGDGTKVLNLLYEYNAMKNIWKIVAEYDGQQRYNAVSTQTDFFLIVIGGEEEENPCIKTAFVIDINLNFSYRVIPIKDCIVAAAITSVKDTIYIHGGLQREFSIVDQGSMNRFLSYPLSDFLNSTNCLPGSYLDNTTCKYCVKGNYCPYENSSFVIPCPPGTFNSFEGAYLPSQCEPCNYGTWNSNSGQWQCRDCTFGYICSGGCTKPVLSYLKTSEITSKQPKLMQSNAKLAWDYKFTSMVAIGSAALTFLTFVAFLARLEKLYPSIKISEKNRTEEPISSFSVEENKELESDNILNQKDIKKAIGWNRLRKYCPSKSILKDIDTFKYGHNYKNDGSVMKLRKTYVGGFYTVVLFSIVIYLITSAGIDLFVNYFEEVKSLVPQITIEKQYVISGNIQVDVLFIEYGGSCMAGSNCSSQIQAIPKGVSGESQYFCELRENNCKVSWVCNDCVLTNDSSVAFTLQETNSFASSFQVYAKSSSSIPDQSSEVSITVYPDITGNVFRGNNPTSVPIQMIPSLFLSDLSEFPSQLTGYHISIIEYPIIGSTVQVVDIPINPNLIIEVNTSFGENILLTQRLSTQKWLSVIMLILGTGFAYSELTYIIMRMHEKTSAIFHKFVEKWNLKDKLKQSSNKIYEQTGSWSIRKKSTTEGTLQEDVDNLLIS